MTQNIEMHKVENSSMITEDGYNPGTQTLRICFANGDTWDYSGIDPRTYDAYETADSKGKYFSRVIKPNVQGRKVN